MLAQELSYILLDSTTGKLSLCNFRGGMNYTVWFKWKKCIMFLASMPGNWFSSSIQWSYVILLYCVVYIECLLCYSDDSYNTYKPWWVFSVPSNRLALNLSLFTYPQVFEKLQNDFNPRRLERCVRLDFVFQHGKGAGMSIAGMGELEHTLKQCFKAAFQTRQSAYEEEVSNKATCITMISIL